MPPERCSTNPCWGEINDWLWGWGRRFLIAGMRWDDLMCCMYIMDKAWLVVLYLFLSLRQGSHSHAHDH